MKLTLEQAKRTMDANYGNIDLSGTKITELPINLTVRGSLNLSGTQITELPSNLTVGGSLLLKGTQIAELPSNLTVGHSLDLRGTQITELPSNLKVGGSLFLSGTKIKELPSNLTVGGSLDLRGTQITELPSDLTVAGYLDLRGTQIKELPSNLTVGHSLNLRGTQIKELPSDLAVAGYLYLSGTQIKNKNEEAKKVRRLSNGEYKEGKYLYADGILTHIKRRHEMNGYTYYYGKIKGRNVVSDGKNYAHCDSFRDGIADLLFKAAKDRGADQYEGIDMDKPIPLEEAKTMYRIITGACRQGTESFAESLGDKLKSEYTVHEMLEVTSGAYGAEKFRYFFEN